MIVVPFLAGLALSARVRPLGLGDVTLGLTWLVGYFAFSAGVLALKAAPRRRPNYYPALVTYSVIAGEKTIDLTTIDTTKVDAVEIKAVASDVEVLLPGPVEDLRTTSRLADVTVDAWPDDAKPFDVTLIVDATASNVRLVVREP